MSDSEVPVGAQQGDETRWSVIVGAAGGDARGRSAFARTYLPVVRAYLAARWAGRAHASSIDDAAQDVFIDCFREHGALARVDARRGVKFRTFLFGVVRNVAMRYEERRHQRREVQADSEFDRPSPADEERFSRAYDRAWARAVMQRALRRHEDLAAHRGKDAVRRVALLRERFQEGLEIREIAARSGEDAAVLHRQFRTAREEFRRALLEEVRAQGAASLGDAQRECEELLGLLS